MAHVVRDYLPRSRTFVHAQLLALRRYDPVVIAGRVSDASELPFAPIDALVAGVGPRALARIRRQVAGDWNADFVRLERALARRDPVAVHAHFGLAGCNALPAAQKLGLPLVTTFYGFDLTLPERQPEWRERYASLFADGDRFLCEGPAMVRTLASIGCPAERIGLMRIGVDLAAIPFAPPRRTGPLVLVQTGRLVEKKGVDLSIRALTLVREQRPDAELVVVGDGPLRASLEALAGELGVADVVRFAGSLPFADYQRTLAGAQVGLQPSRVAPDGDTEGGAPTVLLEMQARGLPVVATRHADIPFVVAEDGALVEEEDVEGLAAEVLATAALDEDAWQARAHRGRELVARHDRPQTGADLADHYDALLPGRVSGDPHPSAGSPAAD